VNITGHLHVYCDSCRDDLSVEFPRVDEPPMNSDELFTPKGVSGVIELEMKQAGWWTLHGHAYCPRCWKTVLQGGRDG